MNIEVPLCVDLDGTLIRQDVTALSVRDVLIRNPITGIARCIRWLPKGMAYFKSRIEGEASIDFESLTYNEQLLSYIKDEKKSGRRVILATAADEVIAKKVASYLGCFDEVIASNGEVNRRARKKAEILSYTFGFNQFIYAGNSKDDLKVWPDAAAIIAVNCSSRTEKKARKMGKPIRVFPRF